MITKERDVESRGILDIGLALSIIADESMKKHVVELLSGDGFVSRGALRGFVDLWKIFDELAHRLWLDLVRIVVWTSAGNNARKFRSFVMSQ